MGLTETESALVAGLALGSIVTVPFAFIYGIYYVFRLIAEFKIFAKAGEKGWKTLIPFYNVYTEYKLTSSMKEFWIYLVATLVSAIFQKIETDSVIVSALAFAVAIVVLVFTVRRRLHLARSFGKGTGFAIGLLFLEPIFVMILGYGSAQYIGQDKKSL